MYSLCRPDRFGTAFIWLGVYMFIDFFAVSHIKFIINLIVENCYLQKLFFYFGLYIYPPQVVPYCVTIQKIILIFGTFLYIIWGLHDNPAFRNDKKFMSRSLWRVLKDTYSNIIWTYIGLTVLGVVYHLVGIIANSAI